MGSTICVAHSLSQAGAASLAFMDISVKLARFSCCSWLPRSTISSFSCHGAWIVREHVRNARLAKEERENIKVVVSHQKTTLGNLMKSPIGVYKK